MDIWKCSAVTILNNYFDILSIFSFIVIPTYIGSLTITWIGYDNFVANKEELYIAKLMSNSAEDDIFVVTRLTVALYPLVPRPCFRWNIQLISYSYVLSLWKYECFKFVDTIVALFVRIMWSFTSRVIVPHAIYLVVIQNVVEFDCTPLQLLSNNVTCAFGNNDSSQKKDMLSSKHCRVMELANVDGTFGRYANIKSIKANFCVILHDLVSPRSP